MNDATYGVSRCDWAATASSLESATIGLSKTSLQALTVVRPMRTPVNEPGPDATANTSTSPKALFADCRAKSTAGNSQEEYSSALECATTWWTASSLRTATPPLTSHVSIASTTIYEQFYHTWQRSCCAFTVCWAKTPEPTRPGLPPLPESSPLQLKCQIDNFLSLTASFQ